MNRRAGPSDAMRPGAPTNPRRLERVAVALSAAIIGLWLLTRFFGATAIASSFNGEATDGTFQLLDPLRRLEAGQHAGTDFGLFHGPLVLLAHWPIYSLAPGLWSVEFQRWLLSSVALVASLLIAWRALFGEWRRAIVATAITTSVISGSMLVFLAAPQQSELGIRAAMPVIAASVLVLTGMRTGQAAATQGVLLALTYLAGYEQGFALAVALAIVAVVWFARVRDGAARRAFALHLAIGAVTASVAGTALALAMAHSIGGAAALLSWPFTVIAPYQAATFGSPPSPTLLEWKQLALSPIPAIVVAALAALAALWVRNRNREPSRARGCTDVAAAVLILQGLVALVSLAGSWTPEYYGAPLFRSLWIVAWYLVVTEAQQHDAPALRRLAGGGLLAACALAWPLSSSWRSAFVSQYGTLLASGTSSPRTWLSRSSPSRMGLSPPWALHVAMGDEVLAAMPARSGDTPPIWSTFTGLIEARHGWLAPATDYLNHVLGPERLEKYLSAFQRVEPDVVQTARVTSFHFEPVMQARWWPFYEAVLANYDIAAAGPFTLLWTRRAVARGSVVDSALGTWSVPDDDRAMVVPCPAASAFLLEANYTFGSALPLPMAESLRRTVLWIATPAHRRAVALGEKEHTAQVPVMGSRLNGECRIWLQRAPFLPARRLSPLTVTLRPLDIDRSTAQLLLDESAPQTIIRRRLAKP